MRSDQVLREKQKIRGRHRRFGLLDVSDTDFKINSKLTIEEIRWTEVFQKKT